MLLQVCALLGATLTLVAYYGLKKSWWTPNAKRYCYLNVVSSVLLLFVGIRTGTLGIVVLNVIWGAIALSTILGW